jgi:hypothetical protein
MVTMLYMNSMTIKGNLNKIGEKQTTEVRRTPEFDSGNGNIFFLDRADVKCGDNEAISQFKLNRSGNNLFYEYQCIKSNKITNKCESKKTDPNEVDVYHTKSAHYLDKHNMRCESNSVIRRFKLERSGNRIYYDYLCCKNTNRPLCMNRITDGSDKGDLSTYYLDRQNVFAGPKSAFTRINLNNGSQFSYSFTPCYVG